MLGEFAEDFESGAERRRSRSGDPDSGAPWEGELGASDSLEGFEQVARDLDATASEGCEREPLESPEAAGGCDPGTPFTPPKRRRLLVRALPREPLSAQKKILLLDTWRRSGLPARNFAAITGLTRQQLYAWQRKFKLEGPAGLLGKPRGAPGGSRIPELTKRTILMLNVLPTKILSA